jgi:signal transduction histidine kinase
VAAEHTLENMYARVPQRQTGVRRRLSSVEAAGPAAASQIYLTALDATSDAVLVINRTGFITYANRAAETLLLGHGHGHGHDARDARDTRESIDLDGRHILGFAAIEPRDVRRMLNALRKHRSFVGTLTVQLGGVPNNQRSFEVRLRAVERSAGRTQYFCLTARPAPLPKVSAQAMSATLTRDCSVLSAVGRVASEIAHDFNNQIAVVLNYSFILLRELPQTSPLRAHVSELQSAAWRASEVAREMLRFGGQRRADTDDLDLNALIAEAQAIFLYTLRGTTRVEQRLAENLWPVRARRAHIEWLLVELAARLRASLGRLECFRITTSNSSAQAGASGNDRYVVMSVEAHPAGAPSNDELLAFAARSDALSFNGEVSRLRSAELALSHARGELTLEQLPEGGLQYQLRLPAV